MGRLKTKWTLSSASQQHVSSKVGGWLSVEPYPMVLNSGEVFAMPFFRNEGLGCNGAPVRQLH